ncbi:hypothetical protein CAEBREN_25056 [Caenorhabditis brenneri]|uniref:Uncharacterized protein n=1 Tax=Caenorhabditis brenneri TaxID=135651 RepID=G0MYH0_CAEBE|nr:hypothetical protein CAEBREN_25056 [Caenorhabditis brenneri]
MAPDPRNAVKSSSPNGQNSQKDANPESRPTFEELLSFIRQDKSLKNVEASGQELYGMSECYDNFVNPEAEWGPSSFVLFLEYYLGTIAHRELWHESLRIQIGSHRARIRAGEPARLTSIEVPILIQTEKMKGNPQYQSQIAINTGRNIIECPTYTPYARSTSLQQEPSCKGARERIAYDVDSTQQKTLAEIARKVGGNLKRILKPNVVKTSPLQKIKRQRRTH